MRNASSTHSLGYSRSASCRISAIRGVSTPTVCSYRVKISGAGSMRALPPPFLPVLGASCPLCIAAAARLSAAVFNNTHASPFGVVAWRNVPRSMARCRPSRCSSLISLGEVARGYPRFSPNSRNTYRLAISSAGSSMNGRISLKNALGMATYSGRLGKPLNRLTQPQGSAPARPGYKSVRSSSGNRGRPPRWGRCGAC